MPVPDKVEQFLLRGKGAISSEVLAAYIEFPGKNVEMSASY